MPYVPGMGAGVQAAPQTAIQGAIPAQPLPQPSQQVNSAENILAGLYQQHAQINQQIQQSLEKAVKPISVSGAGPDVGNVMGQQRPFQRAQLDTSRRVGAHNVKMQNIGNTMKTASNIIGAAVEKRTTEKRREMALDIERIYATTDGMREAEAALKMDPNDANAKAQYEKNKNIQDALLADPKKTKMFEKAFAIDFINPQNNKTPEAAAHAQAMGSYAEQLKAKNAERMQQNTQALATYEGLMAQQKAMEKPTEIMQKEIQSERQALMSKYRTDMTTATAIQIAQMETQQKAADAKARGASATEVAKIHVGGQIQAAKIAAASRTDVADIGAGSRFAVATLKANEGWKETEAKIAGNLKAVRERVSAGQPYAAAKILTTTLQDMNNVVNTADKTWGEKLATRNKLQASGKDPKGLENANKDLYEAGRAKEQAHASITQLQGQLDKINGVISAQLTGGTNPGGAGAIAATAGTESTTVSSGGGSSTATAYLNDHTAIDNNADHTDQQAITNPDNIP